MLIAFRGKTRFFCLKMIATLDTQGFKIGKWEKHVTLDSQKTKNRNEVRVRVSSN